MDELQQQFNNELAGQMTRSAYMNQSSNEINSLLSELTNPEQEIYEVELSLKGKAMNSKGELETVSDPLMNDKGVANVVRLMRSMVNRVMFMSNLEDEQIRIMAIELGNHLVTDIVFHKQEYGIKDFSNMTTIRTIINDRAFEAGMSALENGFRRFLKSGIIETTINTQGQQMKTGKGGLSAMLGLGKK